MSRQYIAVLGILVCLIIPACRKEQKPNIGPDLPVRGFWSGNVTEEGKSDVLPSRIHIRGQATCLLLRHRDKDLTIHLQGRSSSDGSASVKVNNRIFPFKIKKNLFQHELKISSAILQKDVWCRLEFTVPQLTLESLVFDEEVESPKMMIFALDGATWHVMDRLLKKNKLPTFKKILRSGTYGILQSVEKSISPAVWTTIATGKPPEEHGITDFLDAERRPFNSEQIREKRFWNIVSEYSNVTLGIVGWFVCWPTESLNGFMVSDRSIHGSLSSERNISELYYPQDISLLGEQILQKRSKAYLQEGKRFTDFNFDPNFKISGRQRTVHKLLNRRLFHVYFRDSTYLRTAYTLFQKLAPDVLTVYVRGNDYTQHAYWHYMSPTESYKMPPERFRKSFKNIIENYYIYLDEELGRFVNIAPKNTTFLILSDHGFRAMKREEDTGRDLSGVHDPQGIYMISGPGFRKNFRYDGLRILDICPLILNRLSLPVAGDMQGSIPPEILEASFRTPPKTIATYGRRKIDNRSLPSPVDPEILEQLKTLGYIN